MGLLGWNVTTRFNNISEWMLKIWIIFKYTSLYEKNTNIENASNTFSKNYIPYRLLNTKQIKKVIVHRFVMKAMLQKVDKEEVLVVPEELMVMNMSRTMELVVQVAPAVLVADKI